MLHISRHDTIRRLWGRSTNICLASNFRGWSQLNTFAWLVWHGWVKFETRSVISSSYTILSSDYAKWSYDGSVSRTLASDIGIGHSGLVNEDFSEQNWYTLYDKWDDPVTRKGVLDSLPVRLMPHKSIQVKRNRSAENDPCLRSLLRAFSRREECDLWSSSCDGRACKDQRSKDRRYKIDQLTEHWCLHQPCAWIVCRVCRRALAELCLRKSLLLPWFSWFCYDSFHFFKQTMKMSGKRTWSRAEQCENYAGSEQRDHLV